MDQQPGVKARLENPTNSSGTSKPVPGPSGTGQVSSVHCSDTGTVDQAYGGAFPTEQDIPFAEAHYTESEFFGSLSEPEEDLLSDKTDKTELTEDMNYSETVHSVHSSMGWNRIPPFESDFTEPDKSNNPWKGKNPRRPTRISVAMPDDWL